MTEPMTPPSKRQVLGVFAVIWVTVMLLFAAALGWGYQVEARTKEELLREHEQGLIREALQILEFRLSIPQRDLLYLTRQSNLSAYVQSARMSDREKLSDEYALFVSSRLTFYDQIRYLNQDGREVVRVNNVDGTVRAVPFPELQDKVNRYYVHDTLAMPAGGVYISHFDLNVEHGQVEQPLKPMIRFGSKVIDKQGLPAGLVIVNFLGKSVIDRLRLLDLVDGGQFWLVNQRGDWLMGPSPEDEWAFMFPEKGERTLPGQFPGIWQAFGSGGEQNQFMMPQGGLVTYASYKPGGQKD